MGFRWQNIGRRWDCREFIVWQAELDPKEHFEMRELRQNQEQINRQATRHLWLVACVGVTSIGSLIVGILNLVR